MFAEVNSAKKSLVGALMCSKGNVWPSEEAPADAVKQQREELGGEARPRRSPGGGGGQGSSRAVGTVAAVAAGCDAAAPARLRDPQPSTPGDMGPEAAGAAPVAVKRGVQWDSAH